MVTGCSKGVGFATALALASDGWEVLATMRDPAGAGTALQTSASEAGVELSVRQLDVTDERSVAAAFEAAGPLDLLVNNAAVTQFGSVEETPLDDWRLMLETNFLGPVRCMRAVMPAMRERGSGTIVNVSTVAVSAPFAGTGAYAASKAALEHASAVVAIEGRPHGVRVVLVEAGSIASGMQAIGGPPPRDSPYWSTMRNTVHYLSSNRSAATDPAGIAAAIVEIADRASTPFRVAAGQGAAETIALRDQLGDGGWLELAADADFERRYIPPASEA